MREVKRNAYGLELFAKEKTEFIAFYEEYLQKELERLEVQRKKFMKGLIPRIIAAPFVFFFIYYAFRDFTMFVIPAAPLAITGWVGLYWVRHKKKLESKAKKVIVPKLVKFMNSHFTYEPDGSLTIDDVNEMRIFKHKADLGAGDDLIKGYVYDRAEDAKTYLSFSEIVVRNDYKKRQKGKVIQKPLGMLVAGLLFKVEFNKDFGRSFTMIKPRWLMKKRKYRKKLKQFDDERHIMQEVLLENPMFMKKFVVHSTDQIEARVILQTDTMENLLEFVSYVPDTIKRKQTKRKKERFIPYFAFYNNLVYVLIHTRSNHFILNIMKELDIDTVYDYFKDINLVLRFIDDLNLNLKLYKK